MAVLTELIEGEFMMKKAMMMFVSILTLMIVCVPAGFAQTDGASGSSDADLAQELSNPLADLITVPVQVNYERNVGVRDDGWKLQTNIQPVIPIDWSADWNLITRTIVPVISQGDIAPGVGSQFGLGDINISLFFSPKEPTAGGLIWGVGPVFLMPTATDSLLGAKKWGVGPAAVALTSRGPWTMGMLANHIWSVAGDSDRPDISSTFMQPFAAYTTPDAWTISFQSETTYNRKSKKWSVPVNLGISKLVRWGRLPVSLQGGVGYWLESPDSGPEGFRFRFQANFVLPKP